MTKWENLLKDAGVESDMLECVNTSVIRTPIGYSEDNHVRRVELSDTDVHAIVVGSSSIEVTNMCRVLSEGIKSVYGDACGCHIYSMADGFWSSIDRTVRYGKRTTEERINTDNEALALLYRLEATVTYRIRLLSLMNCKNSLEWNDKLNSLVGTEMTDEQLYCLTLSKGSKWDWRFYMKNDICILNGFLNFIRSLPAGRATTVDRLLNTMLKLGRSVGLHLVITGSNISGLKSAYKDMFTLRILLHCSEAVSMGLLDNLKAANISGGKVLVLSSEMVRPTLVVGVPEMKYSDDSSK